MNQNITALILCGGKGERLRPITESIPKPLVHIKEKPILGYLLDHIQKYGITNIVIAAGYKAEKIHEFFHENPINGNLKIVDSGDVDIIQRIKDCAPHIKGDFILFYGDTLANVDIDRLINFHHSHDSNATITLWPLKSQFGLATLDSSDTVTSFKEKPTLNEWINIGHFYFENSIFEKMQKHSTYVDFLDTVTKEKQLKGYKHLGIHITVNTLRELEDAEQNIHEFKK